MTQCDRGRDGDSKNLRSSWPVWQGEEEDSKRPGFQVRGKEGGSKKPAILDGGGEDEGSDKCGGDKGERIEKLVVQKGEDEGERARNLRFNMAKVKVSSSQPSIAET